MQLQLAPSHEASESSTKKFLGYVCVNNNDSKKKEFQITHNNAYSKLNKKPVADIPSTCPRLDKWGGDGVSHSCSNSREGNKPFNTTHHARTYTIWVFMNNPKHQ